MCASVCEPKKYDQHLVITPLNSRPAVVKWYVLMCTLWPRSVCLYVCACLLACSL